jgi:hypothetical protein
LEYDGYSIAVISCTVLGRGYGETGTYDMPEICHRPFSRESLVFPVSALSAVKGF